MARSIETGSTWRLFIKLKRTIANSGSRDTALDDFRHASFVATPFPRHPRPDQPRIAAPNSHASLKRCIGATPLKIALLGRRGDVVQ
jgi:hypothetical protein